MGPDTAWRALHRGSGSLPSSARNCREGGIEDWIRVQLGRKHRLRAHNLGIAARAELRRRHLSP